MIWRRYLKHSASLSWNLGWQRGPSLSSDRGFYVFRERNWIPLKKTGKAYCVFSSGHNTCQNLYFFKVMYVRFSVISHEDDSNTESNEPLGSLSAFSQLLVQHLLLCSFKRTILLYCVLFCFRKQNVALVSPTCT